MGDRVKVACINWSHADAPHAISYVLRDGDALADAYHDTWDEAMERAQRLARILHRGATSSDA